MEDGRETAVGVDDADLPTPECTILPLEPVTFAKTTSAATLTTRPYTTNPRGMTYASQYNQSAWSSNLNVIS